MVQSWIEEMASFVKEQDPRHLLTVGMEGFWGRSSVVAGANPGQWAEETGQNFTRNHLPVAIDFATTHIWPDNWDQYVPFCPPCPYSLVIWDLPLGGCAPAHCGGACLRQRYPFLDDIDLDPCGHV